MTALTAVRAPQTHDVGHRQNVTTQLELSPTGPYLNHRRISPRIHPTGQIGAKPASLAGLQRTHMMTATVNHQPWQTVDRRNLRGVGRQQIEGGPGSRYQGLCLLLVDRTEVRDAGHVEQRFEGSGPRNPEGDDLLDAFEEGLISSTLLQ